MRRLAGGADGAELGIIDQRHGRQLGGGIGVRQRAANGAAIARLAMPDMAQRFRQQRAISRDLGRGLELALAHHGADAQPAVDHRDAAQIGDAAEIDQMVGDDVAKIHHRHQRLPARQEILALGSVANNSAASLSCRGA